MNDQVNTPPAWTTTIFYLLIIIILFICIVTFIQKSSGIVTEPSLNSIRCSVVTFGVGLSLICSILWIGGVSGIVKISELTQKALWITLIAAVLSITVTAFKGILSTPKVYKVTGSVKKIDGKNSQDISISTRVPLLYPAQLITENLFFDVWEEPNGKLPKLLFYHPDYTAKYIDLNDRTKVELKDGELKILKPIELD